MSLGRLAGTGKSTLLKTPCVRISGTREGFTLLDPHGDLAEEMVSLVPLGRAADRESSFADRHPTPGLTLMPKLA
jgi:hypothetical protein